MRLGKQLAFCIIFYIFAFNPLFSQEQEPKRLQPGNDAPKLVSFDVFGKIFNSRELLGKKLLLIDFFGTYCRPCIAEFPEVRELYKKFADHLEVVMVNKGREDREELKQFRYEYKLMDFWMLRDCYGIIGNPYGVDFVPVIILISKEGKVLYAQYGAFGEGKLLTTLMPIIEAEIE